MAQNLDQLRNLVESQLDLTLRIIQANGNYAEKLVATNFTVLHGLLQHTAVPEAPSVESGWGFLNEHGTVLADYYKDCVRQGLDYQQQLLAAMSHK